eukprot:Skav231261  [mRNA]  locus=scaffold2436:40316:44700:+ [translate_table: standard]
MAGSKQLCTALVAERFSYKSTAGKEVALSISEAFAAAWRPAPVKAILLFFFEDGHQTTPSGLSNSF